MENKLTTSGSVKMGREAGPERAYFGGQDGLVVEKSGGVTKYYWRCNFCGYKLGGKHLQNRRARIHLSGENSLRNGTISQLCTMAPDKIKKQFRDLEIKNRTENALQQAQRKRWRELFSASPSMRGNTNAGQRKRSRRQSQLHFDMVTPKEQVDEAWGRCFFGLDIAPNKIEDNLFKEAIVVTATTKSGYVACLHDVIYIVLICMLYVFADINPLAATSFLDRFSTAYMPSIWKSKNNLCNAITETMGER